MESVRDFIFLGSKITVDGDYSHEIRRCLFLGRKAMTNLDSMDSVGEGEGGMFQENSIETYILSRVERITSPGWMHETSARTWCNGKT